MHDFVDVLQTLFLIFLLARVGGEVMTRLGQPSVIGELLVGVVIGPHALGLIAEGEVLRVVAELGVVFLLFEVGLENRFSDLRTVGGTASAVALSGVMTPFAAGFALLVMLGHDSSEAMFLGAAMVATSVGVTARVLADLGKVRARESRVIMGAAVIDDVLGLLILAVVAGMARGTFSPQGLAVLVAEAVFFLVFLATVGTRLMRRHGPLLGRIRIADGPYAFGVIICLGLAALAGTIGLAAIVGAFLAGMVLSETREQYAIEKQISPVTHFLTPYFFVLTGAAVDFRVFLRVETAILGVVVLVIAILTKLVPCALASVRMGRRSAVIVGVGMIPRAEVGIIVADIGQRTGVIGPDVFGVVVAMSVLTTFVAPPVLRALFRGSASEVTVGGAEQDAEPPGAPKHRPVEEPDPV